MASSSRRMTMSTDALLSAAARCIPPLHAEAHKGSSGRIAVVGGCREYTGAPYFAAISALRCGADLVHVFCAMSAADTIKAYSPELIVHPVLDTQDVQSELETWLSRCHAVLVGPGLGRLENMHGATLAIQIAMNMKKPLVIDADGLFLVTQNPELIHNYSSLILTPNRVEFGRLFQAVLNVSAESLPVQEAAVQLSRGLGGVTLLVKGAEDVIVGPEGELETCSLQGCPRRCGGQGDLLAGFTTVFSHWCLSTSAISKTFTRQPGFLAAYAASALTRRCAAQAYAVHRRATLASDMIPQIGTSFSRLFPEADSLHL